MEPDTIQPWDIEHSQSAMVPLVSSFPGAHRGGYT